jgi:hypothetical protein
VIFSSNIIKTPCPQEMEHRKKKKKEKRKKAPRVSSNKMGKSIF